MQTVREKIISALLQFPGIDQDKIDMAIDLQRARGISLGEALVQRGLIHEKDLLLLLVRELHIPSIDLSKFKLDPRLKEVVPERLARQYKLIPIALLGDSMTVALADPFNIFAVDDLRDLTGKRIDVVMGTATQISETIERYYGGSDRTSVSDISKDIDVGDFEIVADQKEEAPDSDAGGEAPIIRMVNLVIKEALRQRASDIHMESTEGNMRVRYRVDGVLLDVLEIPRESMSAVVVRIKIMARLDITTTQVPQDGRFKMRLSNKEVDFRVSVLPTCYGPKVVMRVLDKAKLSIGLSQLGFSDHSVKLIEEAIVKPFGMILVTGPTGSGKSTTLYSIISQLSTVDKNVITIEDPVEYLIEGLTQIEVRPDIGLTFAAGLRAVLRQSPDIVMVGEIRDNETADIAIKASLTGQLVFSTLHTNDAAGALTRLVDMKVEPFLVASSLIMVCAQRLARKICPYCKEVIDVPPEALRKLGVNFNSKTVCYEGRGCDRCRQTGYLGRFGITEILIMDDSIREMILRGDSSDDIREHARRTQGMKLLWDEALESLAVGQTTVAEVLRVAAAE